MKRPWNEQIATRPFWDASANNGQGREIFQTLSLKDRLANPSGMHIESLITDMAKGISMVMDAIDQQDDQRGLAKTLKQIPGVTILSSPHKNEEEE